MAEENHAVSTPCLAAAVLSPTASSSKTGSNVARIQRNVAEKQRRDKLNAYISELANIVPMISTSSKRLDKTSILRLSAAHLRICKSPLGGNKKLKKSFKWCPNFLTDDQIREILESVDGFLVVTTPTGKILFTSRSVERFLGHLDIDMMGHSLFMFIHPDDSDVVKDEMEKLLLACLEKGSCRCSFRCRLKEKAQPRSEVVTYQYAHFVGDMTAIEEDTSDGKSHKSVITRMFKAFVKIVDVSPYNELSLEEATADEYVTRHSLDGTIMFADHRLATITGHMPHEVIGLSAYEYIHKDDTSIALFAHHLMFSNDKGTGMIVYRLRARNGKFVFLKSVGCLQYDSATSQVDHFVCVNQQLADSDGDMQLKYFVDRYIPHIKGSSTSTLFESVKALQVSSSKPSPTKQKVDGTLHSENYLPSSETANSNDNNIMIEEEKSKNEVSNQYHNSDNQVKQENPNCLSKSPDNVHSNGNISSCSPQGQILGTIMSSQSTASDAEYFSPSVDDSPIEPVTCESNVNSSIKINQSDNVNVEAEITTPSLISDVSYSHDKGPNHKVFNNSDKSLETIEGGSVESYFENASYSVVESNFPLQASAQLQGARVVKVSDRNSNSDGHILLNRSNEFEKPSVLDKEVVENVSPDSSPLKDVFCSNPNDICVVDSGSLLGMQFDSPFETIDAVFEDVDESLMKHSSFIGHDSSTGNATLSLINSRDSSSVFRNSICSVGDCFQFRSTIEDSAISSMDYCDTLLTTDEVEGGLKDSLSFQEDLSSLLSTTLPYSDSNSLPSANGWSDIFSSTDYSSPLSSDFLLEKDDDFSFVYSKDDPCDLW